jgi:hypothetical protein
LFYFLVVFLPFGICSPILFVGVWVLISTIDPTFLGTGFVVVLSTRVPKGFFFFFFSVIIVFPLLAALCGCPCSLDGLDHLFDPFFYALLVLLWWCCFVVGSRLLFELPTHLYFHRISCSLFLLDQEWEESFHVIIFLYLIRKKRLISS